MPLDQFLIAPMTEGLRTDVEPWLIPEEAFSKLQNAYVWRGRIKKRFGSMLVKPTNPAPDGFKQLVSRLRVNLGAVRIGTAPAAVGSYGVGAMFSIGTELFTVIATGAAVMATTGPATTHTYNTATNAYNIVTATVGDLYFYPALPVMGITNFEVADINKEPTYAFDTRMAYRFTVDGWVRLGTGAASEWSGDNSQFFWTENYRGLQPEQRQLFVTNNRATDQIRRWDGATSTWFVFNPAYTSTDPTDTIEGCRCIVTFKDRLLLLNTYESVGGAAAVNYPNRIRWCQSGSPLDTDAWYQSPQTAGKGGWENLSTNEAIISAKVLRDRLIIFCERSTWELVWTRNSVEPFAPQQINSEFGVESTFSTIVFDKKLLGIGNVGINACNGANVERIDSKIPDEVFKIHNGSDGVERVHGIRDYDKEMVYWTLPDMDVDPTFPTRVLVYNYKNSTWAINDDSITTLGYLQNTNDMTWANVTWTWAEWNDPWNAGEDQSEYPKIIGGNQQGYTFYIEPELPRNSAALQITLMSVGALDVVTVTCTNHNLRVGAYVLIEDAIGVTEVNNKIFQITSLPAGDKVNTFTIVIPGITGAYLGGGTIARVSEIDIKTKDYNFYQKEGLNLIVTKASFFVDRTASGQITVDFLISSSPESMIAAGEASGAIIGTNILETSPYPSIGPAEPVVVPPSQEAAQNKFWHALYPQAEGESVKLHFYLSDTQLRDLDIATSKFVLNAFSIYARKLHRY